MARHRYTPYARTLRASQHAQHGAVLHTREQSRVVYPNVCVCVVHRERESKNVASLIASRAKAKGIAESGQPVDTGLVTVVDYEKTNDAYHSVMNWQETGRKQFK